MKFQHFKSTPQVFLIFILVLSLNQSQFGQNIHQVISQDVKSSTNTGSKSIILMIGDDDEWDCGR